MLYNKSEVIVYYIVLLCIWYIRKKKETIMGERDESDVQILVIHERERDANWLIYFSAQTHSFYSTKYNVNRSV